MNFSYDEYRNIIKLIQRFLPIMDFADITPKTEEFCVIRHDIEFSIDRAAKLAEIEKQLGISTTYTVQLRNNTYNALSEKNIELIHYIKSLGHCIALHQNPPCMLESDLKNDVIRYSATGFRDFTRLASSDPTMWRDVFLNNSEAVLEMLQRFNEDLSALQKLIRKKDSNELYNFFKNSKEIRNKIIEAKQHLPEASKLK